MPLSQQEKIVIFSPLLVFVLYVIYLTFMSGKPFFIRWIEGCFALFLALVISNLLKKRFMHSADMEAGPPEESEPPPVGKE